MDRRLRSERLPRSDPSAWSCHLRLVQKRLPASTGIFGDVACPSTFADWVEQLAAEGITAGCGGGNYCPDDPNIRGQMAVFLVKVYGIELYGP